MRPDFGSRMFNFSWVVLFFKGTQENYAVSDFIQCESRNADPIAIGCGIFG